LHILNLMPYPKTIRQAISFDKLWEKYGKFVKTYNFEYKLLGNEFSDLSDYYSPYANIKVGLTKHSRNNRICKLYHFFLDFN